MRETIRPLAREFYKFKLYPLMMHQGDMTLHDLGTHLYANEIDRILEMESIGEPLSIWEAYLFQGSWAINHGFDCLNLLLADFVKQHGYYIHLAPGDVELVTAPS